MKTKTLLLTAMATFGMTIATMAQNVPNYVPTNGLVGWWPFNGNANDESGNGNNGTVNGAALTNDRNGISISAYNLNGNNDYIEVANSSSFNLTNSQSISLWFNSDGNQESVLLQKSNSTGGNGDGGPQLVLRSNQLVDLSIFHNNTSNFVYSYIPSTNQTWHHIAATWNGNIIKLYQNGVLSDSIPLSVVLNPCYESLMIGKRGLPNNDLYFKGVIDDIGIWNRALTQQEITALYNAVNCANNTTINPLTNSLLSGSIAAFTATTSDPNPSYVWQSDFGQGYVTLNDFGNYSGVNSATLNIANVQLSEHNQPIRVITTSGNCIDTSNIAIINIADTCIATITDTTFITVTDTLIINTTITSLNPPSNSNTIKVFPNPTNDHITIDYGNFNVMNGYQLKIENSLGQQVFQTSITQQSDYLNLTAWGGNGLYFVHIIDPQGNTIDIRKIVLQ